MQYMLKTEMVRRATTNVNRGRVGLRNAYNVQPLSPQEIYKLSREPRFACPSNSSDHQALARRDDFEWIDVPPLARCEGDFLLLPNGQLVHPPKS